MGENGGCLQSCQKCCFKRFKSVHTQATVLQSCQLKLLTLNLFKRCETKQLRTNFIDNSRVMLQKKNKMADAVEEVNKSQNVLGQFKFKFKFKYFNVCCWNNHVLLLYHSTLGNIPRHIYGDIATSSRYPGHVYIIISYKLLYDVITYPCHDKIYMQLTRSLQVLAWRWVERHFPAIFTHLGLTMSYVSEETFGKNWCRVVCQTSKLSTEHGHSY